jgi:hypothetical protein
MTYKTLFKDTVTKDIYHYFILEDFIYYMLIDLNGHHIRKKLSHDLKESEGSFHYFNMLYCAYFDTDGYDAYIKVIQDYEDARIIRQLDKDEIEALTL